MPDTTNINGGVTISGGSVGGHVAGRDMNINAPADPLALYLHQLPSAPSDFVGREAEQQDLLNMIERGAVITGLRGMGGIGKTALGLMVAHQLKACYPDAQFFLDLRGAGDNPVTPLEALTHVVRAFYPTSKLPDNLEDMQALYRSELEGKRALVFFDNAKDAQQVVPLLPPASCLLLITSREHFTLPGLKARDLNVLPPDKARELVLSIADHLEGVILSPAETKNLGLSDEILHRCAAHAVSQPEGGRRAGRDDRILVANVLAYLCGYLPQALRASASLLAETIDLDPVDYVRQLSDERGRLQRIGLDPARNLDMEASLNLSYAALPAEAQRVLARLSVFPADFDAAAEEVICEDEGHAHLSRLVKLSLVQYITPIPNPSTPAKDAGSATANAGEGSNASPSPVARRGRAGVGVQGRYSLHDLVRLFAEGHLNADERAAAQYQHAQHYKNVLAAADDLYLQGNEGIVQGLALFDREWLNIQAGQQWAANIVGADSMSAQAARANTLVRPNSDQAAQLCSAYPDAGTYVLDLRLHPRDQIRWRQDALSAAQHLQDRAAEGRHLGNLGIAYKNLGETRKAIEFYEQALVIMREIGDRHGEGTGLGNLGIAYKDLGETRKAIEFYEQWLMSAREIGDRRGEGRLLGNLGSACYILGETRKAIEYHEQALVIDREIGDRRGEANALMNTGNDHYALGEYRQAIEFHRQALPIFREIGDRRGEGNALCNMALARDELGERERAIVHAGAALKIYEMIEDPHAEMVRQQLAEWRSSGQ